MSDAIRINTQETLAKQFEFETNRVFDDFKFNELTKEQQRFFIVTGLASESGEVIEILKKATFKQESPDIEHLTEELGDVLWHVTTIAKLHGIDLEEIMKYSMKKFRNRFPRRYEDVNNNFLKEKK